MDLLEVQALAQQLAALEEQLQVCSRCGLCQTVCPLFSETGRESDLARGKLALLVGLRQELFRDPGGVRERLERCLLCGACAAQCPSGVQTLEIFLRARAILAGYGGLSPLKKFFFRGLLRRPGLFHRLLVLAAGVQSLFIQPVDRRLGSYRGRYLSPLLKGRHFRPLAPTPFHREVDLGDKRLTSSSPRVALFVGCLIDKIFPEVGRAVLKVLEHHGVGVWVPKEQGCCGLPALAAGEFRTFQELVRHNLARLAADSWDYVVTACASCTATMKLLWPRLSLELSEKERGEAMVLASKVIDISQFLVDVLGVGGQVGEKRSSLARVAYHDPCHLRKSLGVFGQPRALLAANQGYELVELAEADWCCGGGSFSLGHYEESLVIGRRKRDKIIDAGCAVVATGCPACMLQLIDMLSQAGAAVHVRHTIEIYAESLP